MSTKQKVFVTLPLFSKEALDLLENSDIDLVINQELPLDREKLLREIRGCHGLICYPNQTIDKELLNFAGKQLKVISTNSVGYDHIDLEECAKRNIKVGYVPDITNDSVAEFTVGLLLNVSRRISEGIELAKKNDLNYIWNDSFLIGKSLENSVVGIVGLGRIGKSVAKRLIGFNVKKIIYHNRKRSEDGDKLGYEYVSFDDLLKISDFVICSCSLNKSSEKLFDKKAFDKMKKSAVFINVSRGAIVDQDDLYNSLKQNKILGAGLDVTTPQPIPLDHKLFTLSNCFITPYIASAEFNCRQKMSEITAKNLIYGLKDEKLLYSPLN